MECKRVKIVGGQYIECEFIVPIKSLPGFFELGTDKGERRIMNGRAIVEVFEYHKQKPFTNEERW